MKKEYDPTPTLRIPKALRQALEACRSSLGDGVTRSEVARAILADWLRTHGFSETELRPTVPATDAVHAMDAAIAKHRAGDKRLASVKETGEEVPQVAWERFEAADKKPRKR